jgi:hypothetical protein
MFVSRHPSVFVYHRLKRVIRARTEFLAKNVPNTKEIGFCGNLQFRTPESGFILEGKFTPHVYLIRADFPEWLNEKRLT